MAKLSTRIRELDRASALARTSLRLARMAAAIDTTNRSWTLPTFDYQARPQGKGHLYRGDRYQNASRSELINHLNHLTAIGAMNATSKLGRAFESGMAFHAIEAGRRAMPGSIEKAALTSRIVQRLEAKRSSHLRADLQANVSLASSVRASNGLQIPQPRDIGHSSKPDNDNTRQAITISSSPTVVINASAVSSNVRRDVLEALRAHREELFDQLKRESVRRERAQF